MREKMNGSSGRPQTHDGYVLIGWLVIQTAVPVYETPRRSALQNRGLLPWQYQAFTGDRMKRMGLKCSFTRPILFFHLSPPWNHIFPNNFTFFRCRLPSPA
uniref:Uncharacterized protein n=1 Tax=Cucumis melo TaxID=3656 RepID=A0A9I9EKT1_CUCME